MPVAGDIEKAKDLGKEHKGRYIYVACPECGTLRWVRIGDYNRNTRLRCRGCVGRAEVKRRWGHVTFRGGRKNNHGYIEVRISPEHPMVAMRNKGGFIMEHRLVMAQHLGRPLLKVEMVHHKNGLKDDNRLENLELMPNPQKHGQFLGCANCELRNEIRLLQWQIKELSDSLQLKLKVGV